MSARRQAAPLVVLACVCCLFFRGEFPASALPCLLRRRSTCAGSGGLLAVPPLAGCSLCYCTSKSRANVLETVWKVQRRRGTLRALKPLSTTGLLAALQFNPFVPTQEEFSVMTEKNQTNSPPLENLASFCSCCYFLAVPITNVVVCLI